MLRIELELRGRQASLLIGPWWRWSWDWWAGAMLIEAGPARIAFFGRRMYWRD